MSGATRTRRPSITTSRPSRFDESAHYCPTLSSFTELAESERPDEVRVSVGSEHIPADVFDVAESYRYGFVYLLSDGSEVGLRRLPDRLDEPEVLF